MRPLGLKRVAERAGGAAAPFSLGFALPSMLSVPSGSSGNGSFSLTGISGSYANNGQVTDFSGATVDVLASTNSGFGQVTLAAAPFLASNGVFSLDVFSFPAIFSYAPSTGTISLTLGTFAMDGGSASYALDPPIASGGTFGVTLPQGVPEPLGWPLLLAGCLLITGLRAASATNAPARR